MEGPNIAFLRLPPLSLSESEQLISCLLPAGDIGSEMVRQLCEATEGYPFDIEELTRSLIEEGSLQLADGRWVLVGDRDLRAAPTVQAMLTARLGRLDQVEWTQPTRPMDSGTGATRRPHTNASPRRTVPTCTSDTPAGSNSSWTLLRHCRPATRSGPWDCKRRSWRLRAAPGTAWPRSTSGRATHRRAGIRWRCPDAGQGVAADRPARGEARPSERRPDGL